MSSRKNRQQAPAKPIDEIDVVVKPVLPDSPEHIRCPICFYGRGGTGVMYGEYRPKHRIYLRCNCCGHTWTADVKVHHEVISIDHRLPSGIETR